MNTFRVSLCIAIAVAFVAVNAQDHFQCTENYCGSKYTLPLLLSKPFVQPRYYCMLLSDHLQQCWPNMLGHLHLV